MATKIKSKTKGTDGIVTISMSKQEDFKAIKLKADGQIYVEHVILADALIARGKATHAKDVEFEIEPSTIKFIEEIKE